MGRWVVVRDSGRVVVLLSAQKLLRSVVVPQDRTGRPSRAFPWPVLPRGQRRAPPAPHLERCAGTRPLLAPPALRAQARQPRFGGGGRRSRRRRGSGSDARGLPDRAYRLGGALREVFGGLKGGRFGVAQQAAADGDRPDSSIASLQWCKLAGATDRGRGRVLRDQSKCTAGASRTVCVSEVRAWVCCRAYAT